MIDLENVRLTQYTSHISSLKMGTRKQLRGTTMLIDITKEDLEQIMKLFPITSNWLNMLAEEERIHNDFMKKAQEII